ncbi:unnamed protein product [Ilex paraguariensis]|uniref:Late embryogenesis abundant protein LEA-2 subgroup domain-containing protein n=2 Tax=Ilex paraguariensis TaxID=185542 RepID=A0ABC8UIK7_9AQUA
MASTDGNQRKEVMGYPPMRGHPQAVAHPGYALPYQGYPPPQPGYPNLPNNNFQYTATPPPVYYTTSQHYLPTNPEKTSGYTFARFMMFMMIVLIVGMLMMSFVSWIMFGLDIPDFHVESLSVPSFNVTNSTLYANWNTNVTVRNPSSKLEVYFSQVRSTLSYNDNPLGIFMVKPFQLGKNEETSLEAKFVSPSSYIYSPDSLWVNEMADQRSKGSVFYDMRLNLMVTFKSGSIWTKNVVLKVICKDLEVRFPAATGGGNGAWPGDNQHDCYLIV